MAYHLVQELTGQKRSLVLSKQSPCSKIPGGNCREKMENVSVRFCLEVGEGHTHTPFFPQNKRPRLGLYRSVLHYSAMYVWEQDCTGGWRVRCASRPTASREQGNRSRLCGSERAARLAVPDKKTRVVCTYINHFSSKYSYGTTHTDKIGRRQQCEGS